MLRRSVRRRPEYPDNLRSMSYETLRYDVADGILTLKVDLRPK